MAHSGSWFGLPDFGITEAIGSAVGAGRTAQGGSNVLGNVGSLPTTIDNRGQIYQGPGMGWYGNNDVYRPTSIQNAAPVVSWPPADTQTQNQTKSIAGFTVDSGANPETTYVQTDRGIMKLGDIQREQEARYNATVGNINSGFDDYEKRLRDMEGGFSTYQNQDESLLNSTYGQAKSALDTGREAANRQLEISRGQVESRKKQTTSDISQQLRNMVRATGMQLGSYGAGDSSANDMSKFAYSKVAAREAGNATRQANDQFAEIDKKAVDLQAQYADNTKNLEVWRGEQLQGIRDKYMNQIMRIREMRANAPLARSQALARLEEGLMNAARQEAMQIESETRQKQTQFQTMAQQQLYALQQMAMQMRGSALYTPQDIRVNDLPSMGSLNVGNSEYMYNPAVMKRRQE